MISQPFAAQIRESTFWLLPERALFWPEARALVCSDLHWGRELFLQKHGMPIPEHTIYREQKIIEDLLEKFKPEEWWILGDFIHHPGGLPKAFWDLLKIWCEHLFKSHSHLKTIRLVPGNHDRGYLEWAKNLPLIVEPGGIIRQNFSFRHEPKESPATARANERKLDAKAFPFFHWYGHLHPAISLPLMGQRKLPCFWIREHEAYLPAFSRLAGGFEVTPNFARERVIAIGEGTSFEIKKARSD